MKSAEDILLPMQFAQQEHDRLAHQDILSLDIYTRLKHMTLHFLKYAGKIAFAHENDDKVSFSNTMVDVIIICLATANALNVNLGAAIPDRANDLNSLARNLSKKIDVGSIFDRTLMDLVKISGRMAKAIESTDHLERGDPRLELEKLVVILTTAMLGAAGALDVEIERAIKDRWKLIEGKSIFSKIAFQQ